MNRQTRQAAKRHRSFDAMSGILGWILGLVKKEFSDFTLEGKRALEIGTGQFLNHPFGLCVCGCNQVVTIDNRINILDISASMKNIVHARRYLSGFVSHDNFMARLEKIRATKYSISGLHLLGISYLTQRVQFKDVFDFVFSYTTLEHVPEKEIVSLLDYCYNSLAPGGICAHFVDLEDHRNPFKKPFDFLEEKTWETENRLRISSWSKLFDKYNMDVRFPYAPVRWDAPLPKEIAVHGIDEEDLRTSAFLMVGKK